SLRVCLRLPAYSASAKVICFIGKLGGWGRGILPNQKVFFRVSLGFTLAGLAIFFSVSDEGFKRIIAYKDSDSPSSPFLDIVVAFVNFVVWQGAAFLMALIAKSLFFIWATAPRFYLELLPFLNVLGWGFGFLIFAYSSLLLLAATFSIFRVARWYETHVTTSVDDEDK
ncbi:hypothetical protein GHU94_26730, partial [Pseudomonas aeruginosa]|nr:hypothetical protein [Pseudomonas aeruginosa]MBG7208082.1 hypothetical protein [Pseudomonas aeruginosa]